MFFKKQKFLVFGLSKSGISAANALLDLGAKTYIYDESERPYESARVNELVSRGAKPVFNGDINEIVTLYDVLVISPGIPVNHELAVLTKKSGKRVIGEVELGFLLIKSPVVAVTGTNGKTTTVSLIDKILEAAKIERELVGNVGTPITEKVDKLNSFEKVCVAEISSFQLETINLFCPHVSCVLNITPDHLERHYTMQNYVYLKSRITVNQRESECAVLNAEDINVISFADKIRAKKIWFSTEKRVDGAYLKNGIIYYFDEKIIHADETLLKGKHNIENILAAICCVKLFGVKNEDIANVLRSYKGERHRIEYVESVNGKDFYDDSKATNTSSTLSAIRTVTKPSVLILGGKEKGEDYSELFKNISASAVKKVVLTGESLENMLNSAVKNGFYRVYPEKDFYKAFALAEYLCGRGEAVILSPACSSFDCFKSYAERGDAFIGEVKRLEDNEKNGLGKN